MQIFYLNMHFKCNASWVKMKRNIYALLFVYD